MNPSFCLIWTLHSQRQLQQEGPGISFLAFTQSGEILGTFPLEVVAKWLLPWGYGEGYSAAVLYQLKAWKSFSAI